MNFTQEQEAAIRAKNRNILVAAAAGSGKTAVLVERIFTLIAEEGIDIDRLLVVTFTRAAAFQMRDRIRKRIAEHLAANPADAHIRRQETLLHHAQITTIDAFSRYVIRENIAEIDIDPAYRIADEGEIALLSREALDETLHALYEEGDPAFLRMAAYFCTQAADTPLENHILALSKKADSMPWPELWLTMQKRQPAGAEAFENSAYVAFCREDTAALLSACALRTRDAIRICEQPDGPYPYGDALEADLAMFETALQGVKQGTFDDMRAAVLNIAFSDIGRVSKKDAVSPEKKELVKQIRKDIKETVEGLKKRYFRFGAKENAAMEELQHGILDALLDAVARYRAVLYEKKKEKNLFDFSDTAHLALHVLADAKPDGNGRLQTTPTPVAREMAAYYREVMIDEYQDSNLIQDVLFEMIAGREDGQCTRFMVGDVKQSIYRFRLACPELFMDKLERYRTEEDADERKILLHKNFRSVPAVIDSVNALFTQLMQKDLGNIAYDEDAKLTANKEEETGKTELILCETTGDRNAFEARAAAARIRRLVREEGFSYRDIVILLRAPGGRDETWRRVLEEEGIPVYVESRTGYFGAREVAVMLQMLSVLNNPLQDIPLLAVMHSPAGMFTEEETAALRVAADEAGLQGYFYELLKQLRDHNALDNALLEKTGVFLDMIEDFRDRAERVPLRVLITDILDETGFADAVSALPDGERRSANLQLLLSRAAGFEQSGIQGLSRFVHFIESLQKASMDEGEANVPDENADVVRLMSIHKSKGLEFPVVFLAGCAKGFLRADAQGDLLTDSVLGTGIPYFDPERRTKVTPLKKNVIARKALTDMLGEELRVLYVAMTRAMDRLIISGTVRDLEKEYTKAASAGETEDRLTYAARAGASGYLQWIMTALVNDPVKDVFSVSEVREADLAAETTVDTIDTANRYEKLLEEAETPEDRQVKSLLEARFNWEYRHRALQDLYAKTTVTELKAQLLEDADTSYQPFSYPEETTALPSFMQDAPAETAAVSGAARGTVYHKVMELLFERAFAPDAPRAFCVRTHRAIC